MYRWRLGVERRYVPRRGTANILLISHQVIFTQLIDRVRPTSRTATQTLILVHRRELAEQAARHCSDAYPEKTVEIEMGNVHASGAADITVASVHSIISGERMAKFDPSRFKLILVDESHHIVASSFMQTLKHFGLLKENAREDSPALVGVSATFSRFDGLRLSDAIDHIVYHKDYVDMMENKWLCDVVFTTVKSQAKLSSVKNAASGDFQVSDLSRAVNTPQTNDITVRAWITRAANRKSTLVFCVDLTHVADLTATFRRCGFDARFITGDTSKQIRGERLDAFKNREYPVLLNCGVFTEGTDIPNIDCVLLARPTKSRNLLVQMIGRGMRLYPGKISCHVIDMVASLEAGVITTPTLFGLDPASMVDEATVDDLKTIQDHNKSEEHDQMQILETFPEGLARPSYTGQRDITFTEYETVYDLINDTSRERHIRGISSLAWVAVGQDRYILSSQDGSYLTIESPMDSNDFRIVYTKKMSEGLREASNSKSPFLRPRKVGESDTFSSAVHAADTFASNVFPYVFITHGQAWRKRPATESQIKFLNTLRPMTNQLTSAMISKGKATDMIVKVKWGAKGWFGKLKASKKRNERVIEKVKQANDRRQRELVQVGSLQEH